LLADPDVIVLETDAAGDAVPEGGEADSVSDAEVPVDDRS